MKTKKIIGLIIAIVVIAAGIGIWLISSNNSNKSNNANTNNNINSNANTNENKDKENTINDKNTEDRETFNSKNIAIIYFSATGTTRKVAGYIKELTGGDLIEIVPKEKYTDNDLNYNNSNSRATKEQNDSSARPEIANTIDTASYDVIYLGFPIWWGDAPRIILTFLDEANLSGKTVIPFCTSGSSGISTSVNYFKNNYKNVNWLDGKRLNSSQSEVKEWVNGLNY